MEFKITGLDEFKNKIDKIQEQVEEVAKSKEISFEILFNDDFMKEHTKFNSFNELLKNSGFEVNNQDDFKAIPDAEWDVYIKNNTDFENWKEMMQTAGQEYYKKQLKNIF